MKSNNVDYYKAYDERYKKVHEKGNLWEYFEPTKEIENILKELNINNNILDLGCGEGRDAIYLLEKGYNVDACDYSKEAINCCNNITNNKYKNNFFTLDIFKNKFTKKYNFIYSICVLHMFVLNEHRKKYFEFLYDHLNLDGYALIIVLGDGISQKETNIDEAFKLEKRIIQNTNISVNIPKTSCKIVTREELNKEITSANFKIIKEWISYDVPGFNETMCTLIKK